VVSKTLQQYCLKKYHKQTTYIPNGVTAACTVPLLLSRWKLQPNKYVLMVSRLIPHKGAHYLIEAWKKAQERNPELFNAYKLVIAGGGHFTEKYVKKLHTMVEGQSNIVLTGWVKGRALEDLYSNTALLVHPSETEGLPLVVLEAMSCGRAALVSDIPEHKEMILDKRFWFTNTDVESLATKLTELLQQPTLLKEVGQKNKEIAEQHYNWDDIVKKSEEVYLTKK
jgi:glycosyltransferase involved in cell wall biosynthesis